MLIEKSRSSRFVINPVLAWLFVAVWMIVIFLFSAQNGNESGALSRGISKAILLFFNPTANDSAIAAFEDIIRSTAHGTVFFVLALLVSYALSRIEISDIRNVIFALVISALYAGSDEWHQAYVPGRACELKDFGIDLLGIVLALLLYQGVSSLIFLRRQAKDQTNQAEE